MSCFNLCIDVLLDAYRSGKQTPKKLILLLREQALEQAEYNAWIYLLSKNELTHYLSKLEGKSPDDLPLFGVPFAIKDNIDLANIPTTAGCPEFSYIPTEDAFVVKQLIQAGAIPLGKTNMDQFATGLVGTRSPYGQGKNAFNPAYCSGGSSSGSAISTALGQVSFALGTDTAGSGRVPAAFNNLIGHKPTKGVFGSSGLVPACRTLDCISVFALTAKDAATVFDCAAKYDQNDAFARENSYKNIARYYKGTSNSKFRFGVPNELDFQNNKECQALYQQAVDALVEMGGESVALDFSPFIAAAKLLYEGPWVAERWLATEGVKQEYMLPVIKNIIGAGNKTLATDAFAAQYKLAEYKRICDDAIAGLDFVLTPTTPTTFTRAEIDEQPIVRNSILGTYTNFMNLLDYSATAVPIGQTASGVYWGVTLFSNAFSDISLLNAAGALQSHFELPLGATGHAFSSGELAASSKALFTQPDSFIDVIVCGAHLDGQPLNWQLTERGAKFIECTKSAPKYKLYALSDGKRPGMQKVKQGGNSIEIEVWRMPEEHFGSFVAGIPAPLGIGKVELKDGRSLSGFICDGYGLAAATDITEFGSWRAWLSR